LRLLVYYYSAYLAGGASPIGNLFQNDCYPT
jgi:hypothetical protein